MGKHTVNIDWLTGLLLLCIALLGLFLLLTVNTGLFTQQLIFFIFGVILMVLVSLVDPVILWWFAPYGYVLSLVFLVLSYFGPSIRGSTRWIVIGGAQLQPSELAKPFLLLAFSWFMTKYSPRQAKNLPLHALLFFLPFALVFKQPDFGTSIVYGSMWLTMIIAGGIPLVVLLLAAAVGVVVFPFIWSVLALYQKARVLTFLNPALDPRGAGYNALQAMIAVGSGQLLGRGLGRGTQSHLRFLPEHHTDFIFATLIEELGFAGGLLLLLAYGFLLHRIISPLIKGVTIDPKVFMYSAGLFAMLLSQAFIHAGMNMGLIPITGITLPLVSYGGSSILATLVSFGLLWAIRSKEEPGGAIAIR